MLGNPLPRHFYYGDPLSVARRLLGKLLVRMWRGKRLSGVIVEVEAYYGAEDPASRARKGGDLARVMAGECGRALIYGVHGRWLLNVVAHEPGGIGAILIRAIEPREGIELMMENRGVRGLRLLTSGPGRLTQALAIDKSLHGKPLYTTRHGLWIEPGIEVGEAEIARSYRIGVSEDLDEPLRLYIRGSPFVSRAKPGSRRSPPVAGLKP
ncbi:MAG: DNA-3-methyladenine glycosylase [Thermoprotei archaeon]|nr:MAG: DNA-3-methyladenine glycosylase [Thermoprotei archaeon]